MNIREAVASIIGKKAGAAIIAEMGIDWAVVAAMEKATTAHDPRAIAAIRAWNAVNSTEPSRPAMTS